MPNFLIDEDTDLLAAEFVLGTLDSEERANAQSLLRTDHGFIAMVRIWERRFGELHLMVEPVEPDAKILQRIKAKIAEISASEPAPDRKPPAEATPSPQPPDATGSSANAEMPKPVDVLADGEPPKPLDVPASGISATGETEKATPTPPEIPSDVIRSRGRWRMLGVCMTLLVMGLAALLAAWRFVPDRLPAGLRPAQLMTSIGIQALPKAAPAVKPAPPESQFDE
jgi:hypothetical protein